MGGGIGQVPDLECRQEGAVLVFERHVPIDDVGKRDKRSFAAQNPDVSACVCGHGLQLRERLDVFGKTM